ncbi:Hypothetical protein, putative [Bodo saltans]|uniref:Uncharacterized protein n=1 Tax=Bodo saltans TaxID=75058 RepID=A0A0S4JP30_BODSA|nr:Hypothetical protein, putative [Bodo saltans]|eukprot:CUG91972.1 Hypothetical protein, putative [Bodo saltans]
MQPHEYVRSLLDDSSINTEELLISFRAALNHLDTSSTNSSLLKSMDMASLRSMSHNARPSVPLAFSPPTDGRPPFSPGTNLGSSMKPQPSPPQAYKPHPPPTTQPPTTIGVYEAPSLKSHRSMRTVEELPGPTRSVLVNGGCSDPRYHNTSPRSESPADPIANFKIVDASELADVRKRHAAQQRREFDNGGSPRPNHRCSASTTATKDISTATATCGTSVAPPSSIAPLPGFVTRNLIVPQTIASRESISLFTAEQLESFASVVLGASTATTQPPSQLPSIGHRDDHDGDSASSSIRSADGEEQSFSDLLAARRNNNNCNLSSNHHNKPGTTSATLSPIMVPSTSANLCTFPAIQGVGSSSQNGLSYTSLCTCDPTLPIDAQGRRRCSGCRASTVVKEAGGKQAFMERMKSLYSEQSLHSVGGRWSSA